MNFFKSLFQRLTARQQEQKKVEKSESQDPIRVQEAVFTQQFTFQKQIAILDRESYHKLSKQKWVFESDTLPYHKLDELLKHIETATCIQLVFRYYENYIQLPRNVCHPHFSKLTYLAIVECYISSIESLSFIEAPQITKVLITETYISNLKPLDKIYWPNLEHFRFRSNMVQSILCLGRVVMNKKVDFMVFEQTQRCNGQLPFVKAIFQTTTYLDLKKRLGEDNSPKLLNAICRKLDIKNKD